ncbi:MAG: sigma-54 dependent transcriptional regulator [Thermodesulfobacteriota bacterium]
MKTVMVIDDEKDIRDSLCGVLGDEGYKVLTAESAEHALSAMEFAAPDVILLDIWMPGMDGVEMLGKLREQYVNIPVIMISGHATIDTAVKTTKLGAYDFIEKPLSLDKVVITVDHAFEQKSLVEENIALREGVHEEYNIIGSTPVMSKLKSDIERVAPTNSWVLITGENGTGKEFVARNLHLLSERVRNRFVEVNCAAIPEDLIESELFGHEKGAFTGAVSSRKGKFDQADKGTIFLDEIGDMSLKTQAKILRILQEQSFERVGGSERIMVDVRVIAATNKDLVAEIKNGNFREDLYYRLNVIPFVVPPLRERRADIPLFLDHFLKEFSRKTAREERALSKDAVNVLTNYPWPGNVRELKNLIERLVIMTVSREIGVPDLPGYIAGAASSEEVVGAGEISDSSVARAATGTLKDARAEFERDFILKKLDEHDGNIAKTAESIGVERSHLYRKIKGYGITV